MRRLSRRATKTYAGGIGAAALLLALACGAEREETEAVPEASAGRIVYERHCAACHGLDGRGDGPVAKTLHTKPADLTRLAERRGEWDEAWVVSSIDGRRVVAAHGPRDMPVWGSVFEDELASEQKPYPRYTTFLKVRGLAQYLETIQR